MFYIISALFRFLSVLDVRNIGILFCDVNDVIYKNHFQNAIFQLYFLRRITTTVRY